MTTASDGASRAAAASGIASVIHRITVIAVIAASPCPAGVSPGSGSAVITTKASGARICPARRRLASKRASASVRDSCKGPQHRRVPGPRQRARDPSVGMNGTSSRHGMQATQASAKYTSGPWA